MKIRKQHSKVFLKKAAVLVTTAAMLVTSVTAGLGGLNASATTTYWTDNGNYDTSWYSGQSSTYTINSASQLAGLAVLNDGLDGFAAVNFNGKTINLTESIDLSANLWTPIGTGTIPFNGNFDGESNTITGLQITTTANYQGFFGYINPSSTIKNVWLVGNSISGGTYVGGVVGYNRGTILNSYSSGTVSGNLHVGGVVGVNYYGIVSDSYNTGTVSGNNYVGGVAGGNYATTSNCYNTGTVSGGADVGGVVGYNIAGTVSNSYNTGAVSGQNLVGGVVGKNSASVSNTYYYGCNVGVGGTGSDTAGQTTPFVTLSANSIAIGENTTITQNDTSALNGPSLLGNDFTVAYSNYQSDAVTMSYPGGIPTVTAIVSGSTNVTGTMTITQNELAGGTGFTGATQTISVPVSMPLTVTQATPTITVTSDANSVAAGETVTLTATLSNAADPTGTVAFLNGTDTLGTAAVNAVDGEYEAQYAYTPTTVNDLSITADYSGDSNNTSVTSASATSVTVIPAVYALTVTAGTGGTITTDNSGNYAAGDVVDITASPSSGYSFSGWTTSNGGTFGDATNASTTLTMPASADTVTANFTKSGGNSEGGYIPPTPAPTDKTITGTADGGGSTGDTTVPTSATIPSSDTDTSTTANVIVNLSTVTITAPASVLSDALGGDDTSWLKLSQATTAPSTQTAIETAAATSYVTPVSTFDVDLTRYYSDGTSEAVHQLSGDITVVIKLTDAQIAAITDASKAHLLYYNPDTGALTDMGATFDLTAGTATFQTNHFSTFIIATNDISTTPVTSIGVTYSAHVQKTGWQAFVNDGQEAGTDHKSLRAEAVQIKLTGDVPTGAEITYQAHVQDLGWLSAVSDGAKAGTTGQNRRLEALKITLSDMPGYEVKYRVHVQSKGWLAWQTTANGTDISKAAIAGTTGQSRRVEAIEIEIVKQ